MTEETLMYQTNSLSKSWKKDQLACMESLHFTEQSKRNKIYSVLDHEEMYQVCKKGAFNIKGVSLIGASSKVRVHEPPEGTRKLAFITHCTQ